MATRREARERALELLYESEIKGESPIALTASLPVTPDPWTVELVAGVEADRQHLDRCITRHLRQDWEIDRLALVDLLILRLGAWELEHGDAPAGVVLSEAVGLAKRYSGDEAARFVNGLLAALSTTQ